ncbi:MAG TPA: redox-sensing transcriptional repressor Rex [Frankiaceae bacterium]|nr:redox-sensing transcriptional repressor Rex [Frankiaceae bacterium]
MSAARSGAGRPAVPPATVARLPLYLRALTALLDDGMPTVSSEALAAAVGVTGAKVRKDLSQLGSYGTRGVGYDVASLTDEISRELGLTQNRSVVLVGVGNLGRALAGYGGFAARGFRVAGLLDVDPRRVGEVFGGVRVRPLEELEQVVQDAGTPIGVIATPAGAAQGVCDRMVACGVRSILNFAPVVLVVPAGVELRKVDLAVELQILSFHEARRVPELVDPARPIAITPARSAPAASGVLVR